jgi:hypothetical protein
MLDGTDVFTEHKHVLCATVTAIVSTERFVFAGEGNILKVFSKGASEYHCLFQHPLFESQAIHGLVVLRVRDGHHIVLGWGGNRVRGLLLDLQTSISL